MPSSAADAKPAVAVAAATTTTTAAVVNASTGSDSHDAKASASSALSSSSSASASATALATATATAGPHLKQLSFSILRGRAGSDSSNNSSTDYGDEIKRGSGGDTPMMQSDHHHADVADRKDGESKAFHAHHPHKRLDSGNDDEGVVPHDAPPRREHHHHDDHADDAKGESKESYHDSRDHRHGTLPSVGSDADALAMTAGSSPASALPERKSSSSPVITSDSRSGHELPSVAEGTLSKVSTGMFSVSRDDDGENDVEPFVLLASEKN